MLLPNTRSVLEPLLFLLFINDISNYMHTTPLDVLLYIQLLIL